MVLSKNEKEKRKLERNKLKYEKEHKIINGIDHKFCNLHNKYFPNEEPWVVATLEYFYKNDKNSLDGLSTRCKRCDIKQAQQRSLENREKLLPYWINYYFEHKDRKREINQQWMQKHQDERSEYLAKYRKTKKYKLSSKKSQENRKLHKTHELTKIEWKSCKEYFDNCCAYCGKPIGQNFVKRRNVLKLFDFCKDHADNYGSNDITNCIPACDECNRKKKILPLFKFFEIHNITDDKINKIIKWLKEDCFKYKEKAS